MTEIRSNQTVSGLEVQHPQEVVDFRPGEISHSEPIMPKPAVSGAERIGVVAESRIDNIKAVGGVHVEDEALKVLPEEVASTMRVSSDDIDKSSSWLNALKGRLSKLKGAA